MEILGVQITKGAHGRTSLSSLHTPPSGEYVLISRDGTPMWGPMPKLAPAPSADLMLSEKPVTAIGGAETKLLEGGLLCAALGGRVWGMAQVAGALMTLQVAPFNGVVKKTGGLRLQLPWKLTPHAPVTTTVSVLVDGRREWCLVTLSGAADVAVVDFWVGPVKSDDAWAEGATVAMDGFCLTFFGQA